MSATASAHHRCSPLAPVRGLEPRRSAQINGKPNTKAGRCRENHGGQQSPHQRTGFGGHEDTPFDTHPQPEERGRQGDGGENPCTSEYRVGVLRTTTMARKPMTNSGTMGGCLPLVPICEALRRRAVQATMAIMGASMMTRASLTTMAVASDSSPAGEAAATTCATSCTLAPAQAP